MQSPSLDTPLLTAGEDGTQAYGVYPRRFWLVFLLSMVSMQQSNVWMTWSPAVDQVQSLYGWSTGTIDLLAAWGPIIYCPFTLATADIVERLGMRATITLAALLTFVGTVIRSVTVAAPYAAILAHAGQILNAASGPLVISTPSKLSEEWFPPHERTTATAVSVMSNALGSAVGFLVALPITTPGRVKYMLWGEAVLSALLLLLCLLDHAFYESKPALPPSAAASEKRDIRMLKDTWALMRNPNFVVLTLAFGVSQGTYSAWGGVLDPILSPLGYSQNTVNWLGFVSTLAGVIGGVVFGNLGDRVRHIKMVIVYLFLACTLVLVWFTLIVVKIIPQSSWQLFTSCTLGSVTMQAGSGLFYEAAADMVYPLDPVVSASLLQFVYNAFSGIYLLLGSAVSPSALNWLLTGCCAACGVAMLFYKEKRVRAHVDEKYGSAEAAPPPPLAPLVINE